MAPAERQLTGWGFAVLWGDLGVGLLVLLAGSFLVPALSLGAALGAIVVGSAIGVALLAVTGLIGSRTGLPTMVCLRPALGLRGSYAATLLNVVLLAEDHCTFGEAWCSELVNAHGAGHAVVGGAVENASADRLSWAVYFFDYGRYMLPATAGPVFTLSGVNVSYRKTVLDQIAGSFRDGFWETFAHEALQARGFELYFVPSAVVYHQKRYRLGALIEIPADCRAESALELMFDGRDPAGRAQAWIRRARIVRVEEPAERASRVRVAVAFDEPLSEDCLHEQIRRSEPARLLGSARA